MNGRKAKQLRRENMIVFQLTTNDAEWLVGWMDALIGSVDVNDVGSDAITMTSIARSLLQQFEAQKAPPLED